MEFIEYESFQDDEIPQPQPALSLTIPSNIENLSKKLPQLNNLNNFKSFLKFDSDSSGVAEKHGDVANDDEVSDKYAKLSLQALKEDIGRYSGEEDGASVDSPKHNLTNKLSKVLNSNINDSLIKEIFKLELNEDELIDSSLTGSISRKNLRSKIEYSLIKNQSIILKEYSPMIKQFKGINHKLKELNELNHVNNDKIAEIFQNLNQFNQEFHSLNQDKSMINLKKNLLKNFKSKFILNEFEEFTITNNEINDEFFNTLVKLDRINENSSILLSIENSNLGLNIMGRISKLINKSNENLYSFIRKSLIHPIWVNSNERVYNFHKAVKFLNARDETQFNHIILDFGNDRSKLLIEDFSKQLELLNAAHDPTRYIGDLLAYVHSMVINEIELLNSVFKINPSEFESQSDSNSPETQQTITREDVSVFDNIINILLDRIFERLSKLIRSKLETIISIEINLKIIFSIFNLFDLYKLMFEKNLSNNSLIHTINELIKFTQLKLFDLVDNKLKAIGTSNSAQLDLNSDLQPPEWIIDFYSEILPIIEQSKVTFNSILNLNVEETEKFLRKIVNDPIEILNKHLQHKDFSNFEIKILKLNFLDSILSKLLPINLLNDKILELNELIEQNKHGLVDLQYNQILSNCEMLDFQNIVNMILPFDDSFFDISIYQPITENKLFTGDKIDEVNAMMTNYLPNALIDIQNNLLKLNSPLIFNDVIQTCSINFLKFYVRFDLIVREYLKKQLVWSDMEVSTLLGVMDEYTEEKQNMSLEL